MTAFHCPTCGITEKVMVMDRKGQYIGACSNCTKPEGPKPPPPFKNPCHPGQPVTVIVKNGAHVCYCKYCTKYIKILSKLDQAALKASQE